MTPTKRQAVPLTTLDDDTRRDGYGRYLVVPPKGGKPVGYTRVTTVAKALDNEGGLAPWKATMTATGIIMRPGLRARWEAMLVEHGDAWYGSETTKAKAKELVEECAAAGGSNDRKEMGSALHKITAVLDADQTRRIPSPLTEETQRDVEAYVTGLVEAHVAIVPGFIETCVVLDDYQVAGTFDRLVMVPGHKLPMIADLKTGADLSYSWQSFAVQLAAYSRGDAVYVQGPRPDGTQDRREAMPEVDQEFGMVMWLNAGTGRLELFLVDLEAGWEAFGHSMWARGWRTSRPFYPVELNQRSPLPTTDDEVEGALEASITKVIADYQPDAPTVDASDLRAWLQDRIDRIGKVAESRRDLAQSWPAEIPTLRSVTTHTPEMLDTIAALLERVERVHGIEFPPPEPGSDIGRLLAMFPGSTDTTEENQT
jgi:hypothetical protein